MCAVFSGQKTRVCVYYDLAFEWNIAHWSTLMQRNFTRICLFSRCITVWERISHINIRQIIVSVSLGMSYLWCIALECVQFPVIYICSILKISGSWLYVSIRKHVLVMSLVGSKSWNVTKKNFPLFSLNVISKIHVHDNFLYTAHKVSRVQINKYE